MARIPDQTVRDILGRVDIVDLIGQYVPLKSAGRSFKGLCPFHTEKTPSFTVTPEKQMFYCFGCQEGGNAAGFLMRMEGLAFPEAVRRLGERVGIEVRAQEDPQQDARETLRTNVMAALRAAQEWFRHNLLDHRQAPAAREYLHRRGIDGVTLELFGLGAALPGWDHLAKALARRGFGESTLIEAGLLKAREGARGAYDAYRNRVTFPIRNVAGEILGFGGRSLSEEEGPKYLNSPQTLVYDKGRHVYGLHDARETIRHRDRVVVVEGYFDCIRLHQHGFRETVATLGTAFTEDQIRLLARFTRNIVLLYDADAAGLRAMLRVLPPFLAMGLMPRAAQLPPGVKDPDALMDRGEEGRAALEAALKAAQPLMDLHLQTAWIGSARDLATKTALTQTLLPLVGQMPSAVMRDHYLSLLAGTLGIDRRALEQEMRRLGRSEAAGDPPVAPPSPPPPRIPVSPAQWPGSLKHEMELLGFLLYDTEVAIEVLAYPLAAFFRNDVTREILQRLSDALKGGGALTTPDLLETVPDGPIRKALMARLADGYYSQIADSESGLVVEVVRSLSRLIADFFAERMGWPEARSNALLFRELQAQRDHYRKLIEGKSGHDLQALLPRFHTYIPQSLEVLGRPAAEAPSVPSIQPE